jgi:hypothetical protein
MSFNKLFTFEEKVHMDFGSSLTYGFIVILLDGYILVK